MVSNKKKQKTNRNKRNKKRKGNIGESLASDGQLQLVAEEVGDDSQHGENEDGPKLDESFSKRPHDEDESDVEDKPPKKKKKKQPAVPSETSDKKGKKSIRQMKREKHAQRQAEAQASAKDQLKSQCLTYLSQWKHDKQNWKFMKAKQVWLFKNKFSTHLLPDASWPTLLEYFESAKGNIRNILLEDANKVIKQMDEWTESKDKGDKQEDSDAEEDGEETEQKTRKPDDTVYKRARDLIQCLQE